MVDLGLDRVFIYDRDDVGKGLRDTGKYLLFPAGAGPRHLAFHPRMSVIYAACELDNKLAVVREKEGNMSWKAFCPLCRSLIEVRIQQPPSGSGTAC